MTSNSSARTKGFTIIELVVSLTIMAMVSAAVVSGLRTGLLVWDKGTNHIEDLRRSRVVDELLRDAIGGALPFMYTARTDAGAVQHLAFAAGSDRVRFVSRNSFKDGPNSLPRWIEVRWFVNAEKKTGDLVVEERTILPPDNLPDSDVYWSGRVIQAERCGFDFLESSTPDKRPVWRPEWRPSVEQLPKAVRIRCVTSSKEMAAIIPLDYTASAAEGLTLN